MYSRTSSHLTHPLELIEICPSLCHWQSISHWVERSPEKDMASNTNASGEHVQLPVTEGTKSMSLGCIMEIPSATDEEVIAVFRAKLMKLFKSLSFTSPKESVHEIDELQKALHRASHESGRAIPEPVVRGACIFGNLFAKYRSFQDKVKIAHYTALAMTLDNLMIPEAIIAMGSEGKQLLADADLLYLKCCCRKSYEELYSNRGSMNPILEEMILYLQTDLNPFFPKQPRHHSAIIVGTINFVEACLLENDWAHGAGGPDAFHYTAEMGQLQDLVRMKSGMAEIFTLFVIGDPDLVPGKYLSDDPLEDQQFFYKKIYPLLSDLMVLLNYLNDILSLYKETRDGETHSFVFNYARSKNISPFEAMDATHDLIMDAMKSVGTLLEKSGSLDVRKAVEGMLQGYVAFHLAMNVRYRLNDVLGEWYQGMTVNSTTQ
ncbi:hypothetical protein Mapa_004829 [Marchantia paleacea]|nr:hypothetical protein Mapa_004829 [Marchantia paleacea]